MKKKHQQKKEKNKLIMTIVAVLVIIAIIGGATYAYWSWETNTEQRTHVTVEVQGAILTIDGTNITNIKMRPTKFCDGEAALIGEATFTATNGTETDMSVIPMIDIILTPVEGREPLTDDDKSHLHWALVDTSTSQTCENADYSGTFNKLAEVTVTKDANGNVSVSSPTVASAQISTSTTTNVTTALIANIDSNNTISNLTFTAPAKNATNPTTKTYRLYVWLDSSYTHTNYGDEVSDPMQELHLTVKWSPSSTMEQGS